MPLLKLPMNSYLTWVITENRIIIHKFKKKNVKSEVIFFVFSVLNSSEIINIFGFINFPCVWVKVKNNKKKKSFWWEILILVGKKKAFCSWLVWGCIGRCCSVAVSVSPTWFTFITSFSSPNSKNNQQMSLLNQPAAADKFW